jgi:hypothetical protein
MSSVKLRESGLVAGSSLQTATTLSVHHGYLSCSTSSWPLLIVASCACYCSIEWHVTDDPSLSYPQYKHYKDNEAAMARVAGTFGKFQDCLF